MAPLQRSVEVYLCKQCLLHTIGFMSVPDGPFSLSIPPHKPTHTHTLHPLPQCLLFKVTQGKLGQSSQWSRRDVVPSWWKTGLCFLFYLIPLFPCLFLASMFASSSLLSPQLYVIRYPHGELVYNITQRQGAGQGKHD